MNQTRVVRIRYEQANVKNLSMLQLPFFCCFLNVKNRSMNFLALYILHMFQDTFTSIILFLWNMRQAELSLLCLLASYLNGKNQVTLLRSNNWLRQSHIRIQASLHMFQCFTTIFVQTTRIKSLNSSVLHNTHIPSHTHQPFQHNY